MNMVKKMNKKLFNSYISTSALVGMFINFFLTLIVGTLDKEIYIYIIVGISSLIPALIFSLLIYIKLYKYKKETLNKTIILIIISTLISFIIGFLFEMLIIDKLLKKDICNIIRIVNTLYISTLGVIIGINVSNIIYLINEK